MAEIAVISTMIIIVVVAVIIYSHQPKQTCHKRSSFNSVSKDHQLRHDKHHSFPHYFMRVINSNVARPKFINYDYYRFQ